MPPRPFLDREAEVERLANAVSEHRLAWVRGAGGVGKTALVLHTLHHRFYGRVPHIWHLPLDPGRPDPLDSLLGTLVDALGRSLPPPDADPFEALLDISESIGAWLVIDGMDAASGAELVQRLLGRVTRSRWIVVGLAPAEPTSRLPGVVVEALSRSGALALARSLAPDLALDACQQAVQQAAGLPRRLWHALPIPGAQADDESPEHLLTKVAGLLGRGAHDPARALLDQHGELILSHGHAEELWHLLEPRQHPVLSTWRLRSAVEVGTQGALRRVQEPPRPSLDASLWVARRRALLGDLHGALEVAADAAAAALDQGRTALAFELDLVRAKFTKSLGDRQTALEILRATTPPDPLQRAFRDAQKAFSLIDLEHYDEAGVLADRLHKRLERLDWTARDRLPWSVAWVFFKLGDLARCVDLLDRLEAAPLLPRHFSDRRYAMLRLWAFLDTGRLDRARMLLAELAPREAQSPFERPDLHLAYCRWRLYAGDLEGLETDLDALEARLGERRHADWLASIDVTRDQLGALRARPPSTTSRSRGTFFTGLLTAYQRTHALRAGTASPPVSLDARSSHPEIAIVEGLAAVHAHLVAGRHEHALAELDASTSLATDQGHHLLLVDLLHARCEVLLLGDRCEELATVARQLRDLARDMPSDRFRWEALFFAWTAHRPLHDPAFLELVAFREDTSPVAARRAQALLGGAPDLDRIDQAILTTLREQAGWTEVTTLAQAAPWRRGWGLDQPRKAIWLPDGQTIDLSTKSTLWAFLATLARHGGQARHEDLAREVWDEPEYHPLRHGSRMRNTVWRIRNLVENDPAEPRRVITTDDGYALGDGARYRAR